jgi:D-glycero-alpha-D-manno-heptose 1-phosphate guanylyltransferase
LKEEPYLKFFFSKPPALGNHAAILFDPDGVINERVVGGYVTEWKQFRFRDGIIQAMTALAKLALPMVVVSNQAGVGNGLLSSRALEILRSDLS